mmetsp:Transcript_62900/g.153135  ORF Transcript_62900/g.153135 Transcript_62900/m.153135 type:complete len:90 (-) Transcript_62900:237-506(-)
MEQPIDHHLAVARREVKILATSVWLLRKNIHVQSCNYEELTHGVVEPGVNWGDQWLVLLSGFGCCLLLSPCRSFFLPFDPSKEVNESAA